MVILPGSGLFDTEVVFAAGFRGIQQFVTGLLAEGLEVFDGTGVGGDDLQDLAGTQAGNGLFGAQDGQGTVESAGVQARAASDSCSSPIPVTPPTVTVGVPAETLRRRPDVRRAERMGIVDRKTPPEYLHKIARDLALAAPAGAQRLDRLSPGSGQFGDVAVEVLEQHVDVAHLAQGTGDAAELLDVAPLHLGSIGAVEDAPGRTHPPRGDAHPVEVLDVLAATRAGLEVQHPRQMHAQDLAPGFTKRVVRLDPR